MSPTLMPLQTEYRYPQERLAPLALLWVDGEIDGTNLLVELPGVIAKEPCQVLIDAEVSTDKTLLTTDICIHAASAQHHAVKVLHPSAHSTSQTFILLLRLRSALKTRRAKWGKAMPGHGDL